jgi:signal transduction histidine kinase
MLQAVESYHDLMHEIPLPIWIEDWSCVKKRLETLDLPHPEEVEDWLNARPELLLELYHAMPVVDTNAAAVAFYGLRDREQLIDNVMAEPPVGSLEASSHLIGALLSENWGLDWVLKAPTGPDRRERWMRASCYVPPASRDTWDRVVYITQDVTRQRQAEVALARAKSEADAANRSKTEFLANVSHELRTPLNAIAGFSDLLLEEKFGDLGHEAYRDYARVIRDSGEHLLDLINDLLDLSKVESGAASLRLDLVDMHNVVNSALRLVEDRARRDGLKVTVTMPVQSIEITADERKLRQILINLLSNAVKFTPKGGEIKIAGTRNPDGDVLLAVSDTGIGMTDNEAEIALERFGRVESLSRRGIDGAGLGLPLAKALVELHGGTLDLQSRPGEGTTVTVVLPSDCSAALDAINAP